MGPSDHPLFLLVYHAVRWFLKLYNRLQVEGLAHVPAGAAIVVANHPSALDPAVLAVTLPRRRTFFIAAAEFLTLPLVGWAIRSYGVIPVRRGQTDLSVIKDAMRALDDGKLVVIFPEGRVTPEGSGALKAGAALLAARARVPILPAAVLGTVRALPFGRYIPRPVKVRAIFGAPLPPPSDREEAERTVEAALAWARTVAGSS